MQSYLPLNSVTICCLRLILVDEVKRVSSRVLGSCLPLQKFLKGPFESISLIMISLEFTKVHME